MISKDTYLTMKILISEYENDIKNDIKYNKPFLTEEIVITASDTIYNPNYGDKRRCICGFNYREHFNGNKQFSGCELTNDGIYGIFTEKLEDVRDRKIDKLLN